MKKFWKLTSMVSALAILVAAPLGSAATTVMVTPSNKQGWKAYGKDDGSVAYVEDPTVGDGFGAAVLQLKTGNTVTSQAGYYHEVGKSYSQLPSLSYMAKTLSANTPVENSAQPNPGGSAGMTLFTDLNGDGTFDTSLVYEPYLSDGSTSNEPVLPNEWQSWNVMTGSVWSSRAYDSAAMKIEKGTGGSTLYKLSDVLSAYPSAKLMGVALNVGTYNPGYTVNVDAVTLGDVVYDFQRQSEVSKLKDECKDGGWKELQTAEGQTFKNQGGCVSYFTELN
ncbi:MAG: hypothetical protein WBO35_04855 [Candidatus Saccharimonadales bacterium]